MQLLGKYDYQSPEALVVYETLKALIPKGTNPLDIVLEVDKAYLVIDVIVFNNSFPTNMGRVWEATTLDNLYKGKEFCDFYLNSYAFAREMPATEVGGIDFTNNL